LGWGEQLELRTVKYPIPRCGQDPVLFPWQGVANTSARSRRISGWLFPPDPYREWRDRWERNREFLARPEDLDYLATAVDAPWAGLTRPTADCGGGVRTYGHDGPEPHAWSRSVGCHKIDCRCKVCVNHHSRKRAHRVEDRFEQVAEAITAWVREKHGKVSRNDPCPCGSGRKFKKCCGASALTLLAEVATVPDTCYDSLADKRLLTQVRHGVRHVLERFLGEMNGLPLTRGGRFKDGWRLLALDLVHPDDRNHLSGEEAPPPPDKFQPHVPVLLLPYAWRRVDDKNEFRRLRTWYEPDELRLLREYHGRYVLYDILGWTPPDGDFSKCSFNHTYRPNARAVAHRIAYECRHWPDWQGDFREIRWWGGLSERNIALILGHEYEERQEDAEELPDAYDECPECGRKATWSAQTHRNPRHRCTHARLEAAGAPDWMHEARWVHGRGPPEHAKWSRDN
jgi:hypothetical protein